MEGTMLKRVDWPDFGRAAAPPAFRVSRDEYARRHEILRARMRAEGVTHLAVYGDREHFANLLWAAGLDPRFEEAVLIVTMEREPLLLLGNECVNYAPATPAPVRVERYQPFSLPDMPRGDSRPIEEILREEGFDAHAQAAIAGWKEYNRPEQIDAPSYLVDAVRFACGWERVRNAAGWFTDARDGLRTTAAPEEIVYFEWTNTLASDGLRRVIEAIEPGAVDHDLLRRVEYNGVPLGCHMTLKCGGNRVSLASARGERVVRGGRFSSGISYWGANVCRCGWVVEDDGELPEEARGYVEEFVQPYFDAMAAWFALLKPGTQGAALHAAIHGRLPQERFHVFLNAGHLIGFDEWISSPVWAGSDVEMRSGMVVQADVIPSHPGWYSTRMEDGYALAGEALRAALPAEMLARCAARRAWMHEALGIVLDESVLPLSNLCGWVAPYLLDPSRVMTRG
jgi:Xaa-Pro aminopeptidase